MSGPTPGPWEWRRVAERQWVLMGAHSDHPFVLDFVRKGMQGAAPRVRDDRGPGVMVEFDPEHPDARRIAAAPELEAALRKLLARVSREFGEVDEPWEEVAEGEAALAKAQGVQP